jgi:hypothetical protein
MFHVVPQLRKMSFGCLNFTHYACPDWSISIFPCGMPSSQLLKQPFQSFCGGIAEAAVNRRDLDDSATRGDEPMKALARRETSDGPGVGIAGTDTGDGFEVVPHEFDIKRGPQGLEASLIEVHAGAEEWLLGAKNDDAGVYKLLAIDAGNDPEHSVVKRGLRGHARPPERS